VKTGTGNGDRKGQIITMHQQPHLWPGQARENKRTEDQMLAC